MDEVSTLGVASEVRVLLVVSGGIAAYKAPELVRALIKAGHTVQVVLTEAAQAFVSELSLATVSGRAVRTSLLDPAEEGTVGHIELADWPDVVLVAPATADLMAKAAAGLASDLASTVLLATQAPVLFAPAMNTNMWNHPATKANLATLASRGARFVGPDRGELACGWVGEGRMIDPSVIVAEVAVVAGERGAWSGQRVLVSAGPTRAYLDTVRFFTNASTGAMGFAIAEVAARQGAEVVLVAGPVQRPTPPGVRRIDVQTATEMLEAMDGELSRAGFDLVAMVAAVSDLRAATVKTRKLPKAELTEMLQPGAWSSEVDVLRTLVQRHGGRGLMLGFGAQTLSRQMTEPVAVAAALELAGREKLASKGCDALFVNRVGVAETGFETDTNTGLLLVKDRGDGAVRVENAGMPMPKAVLAEWLLGRMRRYLPGREAVTMRWGQ